MEEWESIQFTYPNEYDYSQASEYTLLQLARHYIDEPNTATLAMGELLARNHNEVENIAKSMLDDKRSDKFLIAGALRDFSKLNFDASISYFEKFAGTDEDYLIKEIIDIIAYISDSEINAQVQSLVLALNEKVKANFELYIEDKDFINFSYNELLKRYELA